MVLYEKFFEQFPNFKEEIFETKYDIAKKLSIYNDQHILNYSDLDILQLSNEIISELQLNIEDFDIPNLRTIEAINLYQQEPAEFYEKYSEMRHVANDKENFRTILVEETEESEWSIVIDKNGNVELWEEMYCWDNDVELNWYNIDSIDDLVNTALTLSKFEIKDIDDLEDTLCICNLIDNIENDCGSYESMDELVDVINNDLKELGFKPLAKREKEREM